MTRRLLVAAMALASIPGGGCSSSSSGPGSSARLHDTVSGDVALGLVMTGPGSGSQRVSSGSAWRVDPDAWEYGRNDEALNIGGPGPVLGFQWAEIETNDRTRNSNGISREYSSTTVRTLRRRVSY